MQNIEGEVSQPVEVVSQDCGYSWKDLAVRLGYFHAIDNFIQVIWLRYYYVDRPYTAHINNSELLTIMLFAQLVLYSFTRLREHVILLCEAKKRVINAEMIQV